MSPPFRYENASVQWESWASLQKADLQLSPPSASPGGHHVRRPLPPPPLPPTQVRHEALLKPGWRTCMARRRSTRASPRQMALAASMAAGPPRLAVSRRCRTVRRRLPVWVVAAGSSTAVRPLCRWQGGWRRVKDARRCGRSSRPAPRAAALATFWPPAAVAACSTSAATIVPSCPQQRLEPPRVRQRRPTTAWATMISTLHRWATVYISALGSPKEICQLY